MKKYFLYFFLLTFKISFFLLFLNNCSKNNSITQIEKGIFKSIEKLKSKNNIRIYPGDTLKTLSKKYNLSINELVRSNGLKAPFILKPGSYLKIPNPQYYKIKKNDTLFKIALCYKLNLEDIIARNKKIKAKKLIVGNNIKIPYYAKKNFCESTKVTSKKRNKKSIKKQNLFSWPTDGKVIATYGIKAGGRKNDGINILSVKGNPVRAALNGRVIYKGNELPAWGNLVLIKHSNNWTSAYAHLEKTYISVGDELKTGDIIGSIGKTGNVETYQLHFQIRKRSKPLDPMKYLKTK